MIIELNSQTHPAAKVIAVNIETGAVDFRWCDIDGNSMYYSGICSTNAVLNMTTMSNFRDSMKTAIESEIT